MNPVIPRQKAVLILAKQKHAVVVSAYSNYAVAGGGGDDSDLSALTADNKS